MIGKTPEYEKMFAVEQKLWWYRILHEKVLSSIRARFSSKNISILDAGCGTGGLLAFLRKEGYTNIAGFDGSADAVRLCKERGFEVSHLFFNSIDIFSPATAYDVIICNDVFYCLENEDVIKALRYFRLHLRPNGIFISNNNAFAAFYGTHDIAIGGKRRYEKADLEALAQQTGFGVVSAGYWSFFLSPLILAIRQWQAFKLKKGWEKADTIVSDVALPSNLVNRVLYYLVKLEEKLIPNSPFGSSLFTLMQPLS